jgi:hypothetical protein
VRRTLALAVLVAVGVLLVLAVRPPPVPSGPQAVRGRRVLGLHRPHVRSVSVTLRGRRVSAERVGKGWAVGDRSVGGPAVEALDDLVETLVGLRAVDAFLPRDAASYGLDPPQGIVSVTTARGTRTLVLGGLNAAGSAVYARREGDPRVLQVGTALLSALERVFYRL